MHRPNHREPAEPLGWLASAATTAAAALGALTAATSCQTAPEAHPSDQPLARSTDSATYQAPGHSYAMSATSPIDLEELAQLQEVMLFGPEDVEALRMSREVLRPHVEEILDTWYGFVGSKPQLIRYFADRSSGAPDARYLAEVRKRFGQWIDDTARAEYDEEWLAYQHEIGLRHHPAKKNKTDGVDSIDIVHFRYLVALHVPVTATLRPFLERGDHSDEEVDRMLAAWQKSVLLQVILWSAPYVHDGEF